jgi:alpha-beta hydrolase superfamily lysophospholipase
MLAFASAVDALFADPNLARAATYEPADGDPLPVRLIAGRADTITDFGGARLWSETTRFDLLASQVANPRPGDRLVLDGETFLVQGEPVRDRERLVWTIDTRPA